MAAQPGRVLRHLVRIAEAPGREVLEGLVHLLVAALAMHLQVLQDRAPGRARDRTLGHVVVSQLTHAHGATSSGVLPASAEGEPDVNAHS
ncbi:hypothetical protein D3C87_1951870 [compost metagenome]